MFIWGRPCNHDVALTLAFTEGAAEPRSAPLAGAADGAKVFPSAPALTTAHEIRYIFNVDKYIDEDGDGWGLTANQTNELLRALSTNVLLPLLGAEGARRLAEGGAWRRHGTRPSTKQSDPAQAQVVSSSFSTPALAIVAVGAAALLAFLIRRGRR
jgi:hypothetical protein